MIFEHFLRKYVFSFELYVYLMPQFIFRHVALFKSVHPTLD